MKHLLGIKDLSPETLERIFVTADEFKQVLNRPIKKVPALRDTTIVNLFYENSTRTRISFELAQKRLGADTVNFAVSSSSVAKGETLIDTVQNILAMKVDIVVMRHPASGAPHFLSRHIDASIVNAGDGTNEHPTQALLDAYSIRERLGSVAGRRILIVGDILHSRVALSNIYCLTKLGAEVGVCGPPTLLPKGIEELGVRLFYDVDKALQWCEVANVLRIQLERQSKPLFSTLREYSLYYGINRKRLDRLPAPITIMHPGPINRGVELTSDVADSGHSLVLDQVENGVAIRMASLYLVGRKSATVEEALVP